MAVEDRRRAWSRVVSVNERERRWEDARRQTVAERGLPLSRRVLAALARFRGATSDRDRESVLRWAGLAGPEAAAVALLARNLEGVEPRTDGWTGDGYRPGLMEQILAGLHLPEENDSRFVTAIGAQTMGERYGLAQALERWRKQAMTENVEVTEQVPEESPPTKIELTRQGLETRGLDLFGAIPSDVKNEIAREIGSTSGAVDQNIRVLRKREQPATTNGSRAQPRPRVEHAAPEPVAAPPPVTKNPEGAANEQIEKLIDLLVELGLQWVKPEYIQENLRVLVAIHRGRKP